MEPVDVSTIAEWREWLSTNGDHRDDVWLAIFKKSTGKQSVSFDALLEEALCWGWVDTQTKGIDGERYSIRFRKRRSGSNWSATNRRIICQLLAEGRVRTQGRVTLPVDLTCPP